MDWKLVCWSHFSWILSLFYQKSCGPHVKEEYCMSVCLWMCIFQYFFVCNFGVDMFGSHHSFSFHEELITVGVCCHHHQRYWKVSSFLQHRVDWLYQIDCHMSPTSTIVSCKSPLLSWSIIQRLSCLKVFLLKYVVLVKKVWVCHFICCNYLFQIQLVNKVSKKKL